MVPSLTIFLPVSFRVFVCTNVLSKLCAPAFRPKRSRLKTSIFLIMTLLLSNMVPVSYRYSPWVFLISFITKEDRMEPMESMVPSTLMMNSL